MFKVAFTAVAAVAMCGSAHAATLVGSTVYGQILADEFSTVTKQFNPSMVVSAQGDEFYGIASVEGSSFSFDLDFSNTALVITEKALSGPNIHEDLPTLDLYLSSFQGIFPAVTGVTSNQSPGLTYSTGDARSPTNGIDGISAGAGVIYIELNSLYNGNVITLNFAQPAAAAVPEPATWAMMGLGFGLLGAAMRRRSRLRTI